MIYDLKDLLFLSENKYLKKGNKKCLTDGWHVDFSCQVTFVFKINKLKHLSIKGVLKIKGFSVKCFSTLNGIMINKYIHFIKKIKNHIYSAYAHNPYYIHLKSFNTHLPEKNKKKKKICSICY